MRPAQYDSLVGERRGDWTVLGVVRFDRVTRAQVLCTCGTLASVLAGEVARGRSWRCVECGRVALRKHGACVHGRTTAEWRAWNGMLRRCTEPQHRNWPEYGGRGIRVHASWTSFEVFLADMGAKPTPEHTIDRIDNDGNYEPGNCRWATRAEQSRNRSSVHALTHDGQTMCAAEWARKLGLSPMTVRGRLRAGWDVEQALTTAAGVAYRTHVLTEADVLCIRAESDRGVQRTVLAARFGVSRQVIIAIARREIWKSIPEAGTAPVLAEVLAAAQSADAEGESCT